MHREELRKCAGIDKGRMRRRQLCADQHRQNATHKKEKESGDKEHPTKIGMVHAAGPTLPARLGRPDRGQLAVAAQCSHCSAPLIKASQASASWAFTVKTCVR